MNITLPAGRLSGPYTDGDFRVYPNSLLFKAGDYPDKQFAMTAEEIAAAAISFASPVPINLQHAPTMLVGKLGEVRATYVDPESPDELRGVVAVPKWFDDHLTHEERRLSSEFNRETKRLVGIALTPTPRVEGAALMAAFTSSTAPDKGTDPTPKPASRKAPSMSPFKEFLGNLAAFVSGAASKIEDGETPPAETPKTPPAPAVHSATPAPVATLPAPDPQIAAMSARIAELQAQNIRTEAAAFADRMLSDKRIVPAERDSLIAQFSQAAADDAALPVQVAFSVNGEAKTGSRLDALKAVVMGRTPHVLLDEVSGGLPAGAAILYPEPTNAEMSASDQAKIDASVKKLLGHSDIGRSALARKGGK